MQTRPSDQPMQENLIMKIIRANHEGNVDFLKQVFLEDKSFDVLYINSDKSNWLHSANTLNPSPVEVIEFYIEQGVPLDAQNQYGETPLHYAVREHNADAVLALLKAGANPHIRNERGVTALQQLVGKIILEEDVPIFEYMFEYGIDPYVLVAEGAKVSFFDYLKMALRPYNSKGEQSYRPYLQPLVDRLTENFQENCQRL